jgi:hypothetical protein
MRILLGGNEISDKIYEEDSTMKLIVGGYVIVLLSIIFPFSTSQAGELDEHLQFLEPLLNKKWVGGYIGSESPDIEIVLTFEAILDGRVIKYVREADEVGFSNLTHFFWNPGRAEICFISLNNKGIVGEGVVQAMNDKIVLIGKSHRPDTTTEFKTILEIDPSGALRDTFQRMEDGEWVQGHLQQFVIKE